MKFFYQVITTPTADTPGTTLCLNFPDKRYFFGQASEGLQRACIERGVKLGLLTDVFITGRTEWANTGGLMGVILTLADTLASSNAAIEDERRRKAKRLAENDSSAKGNAKGKKQDISSNPSTQKHGEPLVNRDGPEQGNHLTIHGAPNITHTMATARRFIFRKGTPVYLKEYDSETIAKQIPISAHDPFENPSWSDSNIKVWAVPLKPHPATCPRATRSQSPRKRSLDEFRETSQSADDINQRAKDLMLRQAIVHDMFNSTWKMDTLHETPLAEVQMPAAIFVRNPQTKDLEPYKGPVPGDKKPLPDITVLVRKPWPGAAVEDLPPTSPSKEAVCYIVRNHDIRGKFDAQKAKDLNVEKGPKYAALTKGESVQSLDGKTITPDMVLGQPRLGKGTAIMEVPSPEYLEDMVGRPEWKSPTVTSGLSVFVWILGPGVAEHPKFQEFIASMSHCKHTVSSTDHCPNYLALGSSAGSTLRLARLRADNYTIPVHDNVTLPQPGASNAGSQSAVAARETSTLEPMEPGLIINMEPQFNISTEEVMPRFNPAKELDSVPRAVQKRMDVIGKRVAKPAFQKMLHEQRALWPGADAEIIALGTGSSVPSKYRNVSATLVRVPGYGCYLLDCGENTLGQLKRVFEPAELREVLRNLRMIWISHLHADHHLGTASVIKAWHEEAKNTGRAPTASPEIDMPKFLQQKPLSVVSDEAMLRWLEEYSQVEDIGFDKVLALCAHPHAEKSDFTTNFSQRLPSGRRNRMNFTDKLDPLTPLFKSAIGLENLLTCRVKHCKGSLAATFVFPNELKISYSGDCRPSEKFAHMGKGSTVLIHEATFQHDMGGMAVAKRHSTSTEALEIGRRMEARAVLLTHFSQRYQKLSPMENPSSGLVPPASDVAVKEPIDADIPFDDPQEQSTGSSPGAPLLDDISLARSQHWPRYDGFVAGAMDFMRIKIGDFPLAQAYGPAVDKYVQLLERAAVVETERIKHERQGEENARKAKNNKKWAKQVAATTAATAALAATKTEEQTETTRSIWSASESEEGWETSDYEE